MHNKAVNRSGQWNQSLSAVARLRLSLADQQLWHEQRSFVELSMRDQYASDISDFLKFSFLRAITSDSSRLGIAWYYLPGHDGRPDGRHVEYKTERQWRPLDPDVYDQLVALTEQSVIALENLPLWPAETIFHREPVEARNRKAWVEKMVSTLSEADHVFLDPDNGLGEDFTKHARLEDIVALCRNDRAISIIKFPGRQKSHSDQISELHEQLASLGLHNPITINTCVSVSNGNRAYVPRHRFFTIANTNELIRARANAFVARLNRLNRVTRASGRIME